MKNLFKNLMAGLLFAIGLGTVFGLNYIRTSFYKVGNPITLPATQFVSGGVVSGNYVSGGTTLMQIGESGMNISQLDFNAQQQIILGLTGDATIFRGAVGTIYFGSGQGGTGATASLVGSSFTTQTAGGCSIGANIVCPQASPNGGSAGSIVAHGIRRYTTTVGLDFSFGESITNTGEPGVQFFPAGGTMITSGILFRILRDNAGTLPALVIRGSGDVGIGTSTPTAQLSVSGTIDVLDGGQFTLRRTGVDRDIGFKATSNNDALATMTVYPQGANGTPNLVVVPKGTGYSTFKSLLSLYNTDVVADTSKYENLSISANGTFYKIESRTFGAGAHKPLYIAVNGGTQLALDTSGNVGIGAASPVTTLQVSGNVLIGNGNLTTTSTSQFRLKGLDDGTATARTTMTYGNGGYAAPGNVASEGNGDKWVMRNQINVFKGAIGFNAKEMWFQATDGLAGDDAKFQWFLGVSNTPASKMILSKDGLQVALKGRYTSPVGTTIINQLLSNLVLEDTTTMGTGVGGALSFVGAYTSTTTTSAAAIKAFKSNGINNNTSFDLGFLTRENGSSTFQEVFRATADRKVGIGTTTPIAQLQVQGDMVVGNYASGNYMSVDSGGFTQRYGSGITWDDVIPDTYFGTVGTQQPVQVIMPGSLIALQCFDDAGTTEWFGRFEKPHNATLTGYIYPHLHRMGDATENTTGVIFMQYSFVEHGKQPSTPVTITGYMNQGVVAWSGRLENIDGAIYDSGVSLGGAMVFRMWRDSAFAGDTYIGNMCIQQIGLHYASDRRGSRTPTSY